MKPTLDSDKRMANEGVISELHVAPNPNSKVANDEINMIIGNFLKEFSQFQNKTEMYGACPGRFFSEMR